MGDKTAIEWTDSTWNPLRGTKGTWSCIKISTGCEFCYAQRLNVRLGGPEYKVGADTLRLDETILTQPLRWKRPRRIFVCSMTDLFEERVPDEWIGQIFGIMLTTREQHTYQVLTKRAERLHGFIAKYSSSGGPLHPWPLPNVWLGVSVENQARADERIPWLLKTPAAVRFLSVEPLVGPVDLEDWLEGFQPFNPDLTRRKSPISWVICGGESGGPPERALVEKDITKIWYGGIHQGTFWYPKREALEWVRALRDQCVAAGVPFFHKQWGGPTSKSGGRLLDGRTWDEFPGA